MFIYIIVKIPSKFLFSQLFYILKSRGAAGTKTEGPAHFWYYKRYKPRLPIHCERWQYMPPLISFGYYDAAIVN